MCLQRWGFWLDRLAGFAMEESGLDEKTRKKAPETLQIMRMLRGGLEGK